ncbi:DUF1636 domain-containing protein [Ketobacter sp. MCCC 1A13808]|uniref:DUF1636 family protein n=1 Tax=Ketobacter sp. MCCC 1A13808 TaxID=2602738 RepID=UPI000F1255A7|nr:DUF1636 domain-containing protein [Ketobacter sp. MCCC 1A13808]MVF11575.1 DUF1636 domain-containing protein [Ketobacter sp. MCCC 1A13808]RLP55189.1 MAG: DUF1636 domain-containing protein [Ketobacter sp.]
MTTTLLVCETCGFNDSEPDAVHSGERLAHALERAIKDSALPVSLKRFRCLMACKRHCVVQVRNNRKLGYVIGDFLPDQNAVTALLQYCQAYQLSDTGQVPYRDWPEHIKGKFIARIPAIEDE